MLAACACALPGVAVASERSFPSTGDPVSGLIILLVLFLAVILFGCSYLVLDRMEQRRVNGMKGRNDVEGLVRGLRSSWLGPKAARALGEIGDPMAVEPLVGALCDRHDDVRGAAAEALGAIGDERALSPLSRSLEDKYATVRDRARNAIDDINRKSRERPKAS
ncbi:MAG TPA: HEAT repeat domain-containing protein, partial [Methanocella sp.]|nr:HEAT repeat domain-containing protein [Methanocella sp.]